MPWRRHCAVEARELSVTYSTLAIGCWVFLLLLLLPMLDRVGDGSLEHRINDDLGTGPGCGDLFAVFVPWKGGREG